MSQNEWKSFKTTAANMERIKHPMDLKYLFAFRTSKIEKKITNTNKDYVKPVRRIIFDTQLIFDDISIVVSALFINQ